MPRHLPGHTYWPQPSFLDRCVDSAGTLAAVAIGLAFLAVGLPAVLVVLLMIWGGVLHLSGVEFNPTGIRRAASFLADLAAFFGIILGMHFSVAMLFGLIASILKDLVGWQPIHSLIRSLRGWRWRS